MRFPGNSNNFQNPNRNAFEPKPNFRSSNPPEPMDFSTIKKRPSSHQLNNPNKYRAFPQTTPVKQELFYHANYVENPDNNGATYLEYDQSDETPYELPVDYTESYANEQQIYEETFPSNNDYDAVNFH